jgi:hypothetical protein
MRAKLFVPVGMPLQKSGGERSAPSQVYCCGMALPEVKAEEVSVGGMAGFAQQPQ